MEKIREGKLDPASMYEGGKEVEYNSKFSQKNNSNKGSKFDAGNKKNRPLSAGKPRTAVGNVG